MHGPSDILAQVLERDIIADILELLRLGDNFTCTREQAVIVDALVRDGSINELSRLPHGRG